MKLNFRLDLNTIVLLLLIVVFSAILYYNFKRDRIVEGNAETFESNKNEYTSKNTTLSLYQTNQTGYIAAWSEYTIQKGILSKLDGEYNSLAGTVASNNSAAIAILFPNTNDVKYKVNEQSDLLDIIIGELNTIHSSIYADIVFDKIVRTSNQTTFNENNTKITNKILEIKGSIDDLKKTILDGLNFTITSIVAGDGNVTITIGSATDATATSYSIKATDASGLTIYGTPPIISPYVFNGLTNDIPYTFTVTADYGTLSDGTLLTSTTTSTAVTPRPKPSFTLTMGTGGATVSIVTTPGTPRYTISVTSLTDTTTTSTVTTNANTSISGLENGILYTFKVIADYDGTVLESDTKTGTPRAQPTLSIKDDNSKAMLTITAPSATDKPTSYIINATPVGVIEKTVLAIDISLPIPFTGLVNGTPYTFSVVAVYSDGTKSSPATISVTPRIRPTAGITATAGNTSAIITIVPPTSNLPATISGYIVTSNPPTKTITASESKPFTISGLTNGTPYTFNVVVNYMDGTSSVSTESSPAVTPSLPIPTATITAVRGKGKAIINILRVNPSTITNYEITSKPRITPIIVNNPIVNYSRDIIGLIKGTSYIFTVKVIYAGGAFTKSSNPVTPT